MLITDFSLSLLFLFFFLLLLSSRCQCLSVPRCHLLCRLPPTWATMCLVFSGGRNVCSSGCLCVTDKKGKKQTVGTWQTFSSIPQMTRTKAFMASTNEKIMCMFELSGLHYDLCECVSRCVNLSMRVFSGTKSLSVHVFGLHAHTYHFVGLCVCLYLFSLPMCLSVL